MSEYDNSYILDKQKIFSGKKIPFISIVMCVMSVAILFALFLTQCVFIVGTVDGTSMMPTLKDGQKIIVWKMYFDIKSDDVVVFKKDVFGEGEINLVKRVIGVEGDIITFDGVSTVKRISGGVETIIVCDFNRTSWLVPKKEIIVEPGKIFVMGDNYNNSYDSTEIGTVDRGLIVGKISI